jgi:hypothetical protein
MAHARGYLKLAAAVFAALFACIGIAHAQAPQPVRFTVFSAKPIADVVFTPRANAAPQKLQFYPTARSPRYEYRGAMPLRFVDEASGVVIAEAAIPPGMADALLLFTPIETDAAASGGARGMRYQIAVLDDGAARHGPGGLAIINFSGLALSGTVNKDNVTLKPGLNPTIAVGNSAKITLHTMLKNKPYRSYADTVQLGRSQRVLLILFPPFYKGALEVQSRLLVDQPPGTAAPPPAKKAQK